MHTLLLVRGLPGSGKSSLKSVIDHFVWCEADDLFTNARGKYTFVPSRIKEAHEQCYAKAETAMQYLDEVSWDNQQTVVVANTFTQDWEMQRYFDLAELLGWRVTTIVVENRHGSDSVHDVPDEVIDKMRGRFQVEL
jgi:predicted kinase